MAIDNHSNLQKSMKSFNRLLLALLLAGLCSWTAVAQENKTYILHTVEKGQSLYSIASMYNVAQADIVKLNPGSNEKIYVGHTLRIPIVQRTETPSETFHTIEAGETLYRLSLKYKVTAQAICDANPGLSADNFRTGTVIRIPAQQKETETPAVQNPAEDTAQEKHPAEGADRCRDMHKVKRRETVFSISRRYGISEEELLAANPELKGQKKIKRGSWLCIPYPKSTLKQADTTATQRIPADANDLLTKKKQSAGPLKHIKAAIILPFLNSQGEGGNSRMVEYYEGFLMAVDSLKRMGTSIELYAYNAGSDLKSVNDILGKRELQDVDVIFGPLAQQQIKPLADFARKHKSRLVIPFTSKDNAVFRNPAVYQINTPQSYLYSEVYEHFLRQFPRANVIFIEASSGTDAKADFIKGLKDELRSHSVSFVSFKEDATKDDLKTALRADRTNIFIPTSGSNLVLIKSLPQLQLLVRENPEFDIHLFGYPEWQTYTHDHLETFFELDTYFYSSFYTNDLLPAAKRFTESYRKWFGKDMEERYPKYGMLGFDTGFFFLKGLSLYGDNLESNLDKMALTPIQTGFKMQRVNNWGGFINKKVFFVHFTKNYELIKLDFD